MRVYAALIWASVANRRSAGRFTRRRTDAPNVVVELIEVFFEAAVAGAAGDLAHAAEPTRAAAIRWASLTV